MKVIKSVIDTYAKETGKKNWMRLNPRTDARVISADDAINEL